MRLRKFEEAIVLLSSDITLQTTENILACCQSADLAFSLIRFVPDAQKNQKVIDEASTNPRYAKLIFEDLTEHRSQKQFNLAVENNPLLARHYISKFALPEAWIHFEKNNHRKEDKGPEVSL